MARTLVLVFHPNLKESRINQAISNGLSTLDNVEVRDMYALYPDGNIDIAKEQELLKQADTIVLQYPIYWFQAPSLMKHWMDNVLVYGWAYGNGAYALENKNLRVVVSCGADSARYSEQGRYGYTLEQILAPIEVTAGYIHMNWEKPLAIFDVYHASDQDLDSYVQHVTEVVQAK